MNEVWICDPNYHKIWWTFTLKFVQELSMPWEATSNTEKLVKKTWLRLVFSTHLSVFGYLMKHSSCFINYYQDLLSYLAVSAIHPLNRWYQVNIKKEKEIWNVPPVQSTCVTEILPSKFHWLITEMIHISLKPAQYTFPVLLNIIVFKKSCKTN